VRVHPYVHLFGLCAQWCFGGGVCMRVRVRVRVSVRVRVRASA